MKYLFLIDFYYLHYFYYRSKHWRCLKHLVLRTPNYQHCTARWKVFNMLFKELMAKSLFFNFSCRKQRMFFRIKLLLRGAYLRVTSKNNLVCWNFLSALEWCILHIETLWKIFKYSHVSLSTTCDMKLFLCTSSYLFFIFEQFFCYCCRTCCKSWGMFLGIFFTSG